MLGKSLIPSFVSLALAWPAHAHAAPKPGDAIERWQLDLEFHDLQRIDLVLPGDEYPTTFWYLLYTVTNNSGADVAFYPTFELVTDTLEVVTGGEDISPSVYDAIMARHKNLYPFFRNPIDVSGKLLEGEDNARTSAAVFRQFNLESNTVTVFVAGLSGEILKLASPVQEVPVQESNDAASADDGRFFILRKTLAITYDIPGDPQSRPAAAPLRRHQEWVMR